MGEVDGGRQRRAEKVPRLIGGGAGLSRLGNPYLEKITIQCHSCLLILIPSSRTKQCPLFTLMTKPQIRTTQI